MASPSSSRPPLVQLTHLRQPVIGRRTSSVRIKLSRELVLRLTRALGEVHAKSKSNSNLLSSNNKSNSNHEATITTSTTTTSTCDDCARLMVSPRERVATTTTTASEAETVAAGSGDNVATQVVAREQLATRHDSSSTRAIATDTQALNGFYSSCKVSGDTRKLVPARVAATEAAAALAAAKTKTKTKSKTTTSEERNDIQQVCAARPEPALAAAAKTVASRRRTDLSINSSHSAANEASEAGAGACTVFRHKRPLVVVAENAAAATATRSGGATRIDSSNGDGGNSNINKTSPARAAPTSSDICSTKRNTTRRPALLRDGSRKRWRRTSVGSAELTTTATTTTEDRKVGACDQRQVHVQVSRARGQLEELRNFGERRRRRLQGTTCEVDEEAKSTKKKATTTKKKDCDTFVEKQPPSGKQGERREEDSSSSSDNSSNNNNTGGSNKKQEAVVPATSRCPKGVNCSCRRRYRCRCSGTRLAAIAPSICSRAVRRKSYRRVGGRCLYSRRQQRHTKKEKKSLSSILIPLLLLPMHLYLSHSHSYRQQQQHEQQQYHCHRQQQQQQQQQTQKQHYRRRRLPPCSQPTAALLSFKLLSLLLLTIQLFPVALTPSGGRASGSLLQVQSSPGSDELSRAVLATMSTQSPAHVSSGGGDPIAAPDLSPAGSPLGNASAGDRAHSSEFGTDNGVQTTATTTTTTLVNGDIITDWWDGPLQFGRIFIMGAIIVGDICGNSLVILSVCRHSKLRVTTNWFVVSLACADILVALFAMTFNASVIISGRWLFKPWVCDFWNSCDVLASTASILHLCCISIDRYIAITRPLDYPMKITTRRVVYALCAVWISSALLSYIPIFTGIYTTAEHIKWQRDNPDQCEFVVNRVYAIVSSSISFWIPCCIMVFTYYRIYKEATRQEKFIYKAQSMMPAPMPNHHHHHHHKHGNHHLSTSRSGASGKQRRSKSVAVGALGVGGPQPQSSEARMRLLARQQQQIDSVGFSAKPLDSGTGSGQIATTRLTGANSQDSQQQQQKASSIQAIACASSMQRLDNDNEQQQQQSVDLNNNNNNNSGSLVKVQVQEPPVASGQVAAAASPLREEPGEECDSSSGQSTPTKRSISKMKREHKAAKTLGIIMGVFILCWLPFFSWYTPQNICGHNCDGIVPRHLVTILFWIGYFNSTLNPIIYAYFNHEFRDAFKKTLQWIFFCCQDLKCLRVNRPNDNQHYNCTYRSTQEIGLVSNG